MLENLSELKDKLEEIPCSDLPEGISDKFMNYIANIESGNKKFKELYVELPIEMCVGNIQSIANHMYDDIKALLPNSFNRNYLSDSISTPNEIFIQGYVQIEKNKMKIISHIKQEYDKMNLEFTEELRNKISNIISKVKLETNSENYKLVISSRKEDLLFISDFTTKWSSCHSFGSSRWIGNLAYVKDKHTYMAYVKSKEGKKQWRELAYHYESDDIECIYFSRQYPQNNNTANEIFEKELCKIIFGDRKYHTTGRDTDTTFFEKFDFIVERLCSDIPYIDRENKICYILKNNLKEKVRIKYDFYNEELEEMPCVHCGEMFQIDGSRDGDYAYSGYCEDCSGEERMYCYDCGEVIDEDGSYTYGGNQYCEYCWNKVAFSCSRCGETESIDDMREDDHGDNICEYCYDRYYSTCEKCEEVFRTGCLEGGLCEDCRNNLEQECCVCSHDYNKQEMILVDNQYYCNECSKTMLNKCCVCHIHITIQETKHIDNEYYCGRCNKIKQLEIKKQKEVKENEPPARS